MMATLYDCQDIPEVWLMDVEGCELTIYLDQAERQCGLIGKPTNVEAISP
jgi:hypothetical protein